MIPYLWLPPLGILVAAAGWMWWEIRHAPLCDREGNPLPEGDPEPDDEYNCPSGCGRTMERKQLHKGTPETGYMVLVCSHCGRVGG